MPLTITLDLETSIHNKGNPFDTRNFVVSAHIKREDDATAFSYYTDAPFIGFCREAVGDSSLLIGCNLKFDLHHLRNLGISPPIGCRIWDVMVAEFILSGQTSSFESLNSLAERYGLGTKEPVVAEYWAKGISTEDIPRDIVESYGNHDVDLAYSIFLAQRKDPRMTEALHKLILLAGLDLLVLQEMEWNGFKYNVEGSRARAEVLSKELAGIKAELDALTPHRINWASGDQLSCFLYGGEFSEDVYTSEQAVYQSGAKKGLTYERRRFSHVQTYTFPQLFKPIKGSELKKAGYYSTAEDVIKQLKSSKSNRYILDKLLRMAFIEKLVGTYLAAMPEKIEEMHWADNMVHGQFNQVVARTGRLSSSAPNMQNQPEEADEFFVTRYAS